MASLQARASSQNLPLTLAAQQSVYNMMQVTAQQMLGLPSISSSPISDLPAHIVMVKNDAQWFIGALSQQINTWVSTLSAFGNTLNTAADRALTVLQGGDASAVTQAQQIMQTVLSQGGSVSSALQAFNSSLGDYNNRITADNRNFANDQQQAQQLLAADQAQLAALNARYNALQQELADKRRTEIIVGIFTFGIGAAIMELTGYIESTEHDIANAQQQTAILQQQMAQLGACYSLLRSFANGSAILSGLTANMQTEWQTLNASLQEIVGHPVPADFLKANILAILKDWQQVADQLAQMHA